MEKALQQLINHYLPGIKGYNSTAAVITPHVSLTEYEKNTVLVKEGQRHGFVYYIVKGAVRSYYLKDGLEVNTWFAFENETVGSLQNFRNQPSAETLELVEQSTLLAINLTTLKPLLETHTGVCNFVRAIIEEYALFLEQRLYFSQFSNSMERYVRLLEHEPHVFQRIPLTYIASYLGIARETLSRLRGR
jgi:CRP/FNR family transcriptional regulator, anaerobic regulatory protein